MKTIGDRKTVGNKGFFDIEKAEKLLVLKGFWADPEGVMQPHFVKPLRSELRHTELSG
jgi:hypothetical protein